MLYTKEEVEERFKYLIANGKKHPLKNHCERIARFWWMMCTGLKQECFVLSYRLSEDEQQKAQRYRLHIPESSSIINQIRTTFEQINRCDNTIDELKVDETSKKTLQERIDNFDGEESVMDYYNEEFIELNISDPNAFILTDHYEFDNTENQPFAYPLIIRSDEPQTVKYEDDALKPQELLRQDHPHWRDWDEYRGNLEYLVFDDIEPIKTKDGEMETNVHYCYMKGWSFKLTELKTGAIEPEIKVKEKYSSEIISLPATEKRYPIPTQGGGSESVTVAGNSADSKYFYEVFQTDTTKVPFRRVGYIKDKVSKGAVYESILYGAKNKFIDIIRKKAELDVTVATKGLAKSYQLVPGCNHQDSNDPSSICQKGIMTGGGKCPKCNIPGNTPGTRKMIATSPQDLITFDITYNEPIDPTQVPDLSKFHYDVPIPVETIKLTKLLVDECKVEISKSIFNTNIFNRGDIIKQGQSQTATEITSMMTPVNNVLHELDRAKAKCIRHTILCIADLLNIQAEWSRKCPSDYKLETLKELFILLKCAKDAGAPSAAINMLNYRILEKQNKDNQEDLNKMKIMESWRPFAGYSESDRISKLNALPQNDPKAVLCLFFEDVFRDIMAVEGTSRAFFSANIREQQNTINQELQKYIDRYQSQGVEFEIPNEEEE